MTTTFLHVNIQSADIIESWKCSSSLLRFAMRARELYFYTHPAITVVLQDINREDSVIWKSDLITFYFKRKTSLVFKSLTFSARKHGSDFVNKTTHKAKPPNSVSQSAHLPVLQGLLGIQSLDKALLQTLVKISAAYEPGLLDYQPSTHPDLLVSTIIS